MRQAPHADLAAVDRQALAGDLGRGGYLRGEVVRDQVHEHWFESELVLTRPGVLDRCASLLAARVPDGTDRLAARGAAATALATAVALRTDTALLLGSSEDDHGAIHYAGDYFPGARVVVVEDIIFTGRHSGTSVRALVEAGLTVTTVVALIDRDHGGRHHLETEIGVPCSVEFLEEELLP